MKIAKGVILAVSIVTIIASVVLYFAFPNPTFVLGDDGQVLKQDYRWIIHVAFSVGIGLFLGILASMLISNKKDSKQFDGIVTDVAAVLSGAIIFTTKVCMYHFSNVSVWPWQYLIMFIAIGALACLITIFSFKETAKSVESIKDESGAKKQEENESVLDTLDETEEDEDIISKLWFKRLKSVIILFALLFFVISMSDDLSLIFSVLVLSMIASSLIGTVCAYLSEKEDYKHYTTTIIVSSGIIGLCSFGIKLFEILHLSITRHFIYPELLCFPVMLAMTNVGISVLIQMINRKRSNMNEFK